MLEWHGNIPMAYQRFTNYNNKLDKPISYRCFILSIKSFHSSCLDLEWLKHEAMGSIYPDVSGTKRCTMMLLSNLAEPEWISVSCTNRLLTDILCMTKRLDKSTFQHNGIQHNLNKSCSIESLIWKNNCYLFLWYEFHPKNDLLHKCRHYGMNYLDLFNISQFQFLFDAISTVIPAILSPHELNDSIVNVFTYKRYMKIYWYDVDTSLVSNTAGFQVCTSDIAPYPVGDNVFRCSSGAFISYGHVCDNIRDCPYGDTSDEDFCTCNYTKYEHSQESLQLCKNVVKNNGEVICSPFYYMTVEGICFKYIELKKGIGSFTEKNNVMCTNGSEIDTILYNDLVADCEDASDEINLKTLLTFGDDIFTCAHPGELPCIKGHTKCFNITDICVYELNMHKYLIPCRNGGHLDNCKYFECNTKFKCTNLYCIPLKYVCDGVWHCPKGDDEQYKPICGNQPVCKDMYKCRKINHICIHLHDVCDEQIDCPYGDDEYLCEIKNFMCPLQCTCLALAIVCKRQREFQVNIPHVSVYIYDSKIILSTIVKLFTKVMFLKLPSNNITDICGQLSVETLLFLDLGFNAISEIEKHCFKNLTKLHTIMLDNNNIVLFLIF